MQNNKEGPATIKDIARLTNVSYSSVSRALSNSKGVSEETRREVAKVASELGYKPNAIARSLVKQQSDMIGLIIPDLQNPFFAEIAQSVFDAAASSGFCAVLGVTGWNPEVERYNIELMMQKRVDGLLLKQVDSGAGYDFGDMPVILLEKSRKMSCGYVEVNDEQGGYIAALHMLACGYRKIAIIGGTPQSVSHKHRVAGFFKAFEEEGLPTDTIEVIYGSFFLSSGLELMNRYLETGAKPEAVFCANDAVALGALQSAQEHGLRVPDDLGIMGFDDISYSSLPQIMLTTIRQPLNEMGAIATSLLISQIQKGKPGILPKVVLETELMIRNTCRDIGSAGPNPVERRVQERRKNR